MNAKQYYQERLSVLNTSYQKVKKEHRILSFLRLILFITIFISFYVFWGQTVLIPAFIIGVVAFLLSVNLSANKKTEKENIKFRKSIYVVNDIKKGDYFSDYNIRVIRPGYGYHPRNLDKTPDSTTDFAAFTSSEPIEL